MSDDTPWDETTRPTLAEPAGTTYAPEQEAVVQHLVDIHDHLRTELTRIHGLLDDVRRGVLTAGAARSEVHAMSLRQNNWTLGAYCQSYCGFVNGHHSLEDASVFPHLRRSEPDVAPVLDRLQDEHLVIHDLLDRVDTALVSLVQTRGRRGSRCRRGVAPDARRPAAQPPRLRGARAARPARPARLLLSHGRTRVPA